MSTPTSIYLDWLKVNGATFEKLEFKNDGEGVGCVYATTEVEENESFATIPFKVCITEDIARKEFPNLKEFSARTVSCLYLLLQKQLGENSFYWPYINILPKEVKTPLLFEEDDFKYIANTNLESVTKERKAALLSEFERASEYLPETMRKEDITWSDFIWSYCIHSSRSFPYKLIDPTSTESSEALFPLADALNHKPKTKITWCREGDIKDGSLSLVSGEKIQAGDQVYNNYGPKSNEELLLGYGFCFEYNEHDYIALKPNFSQDPNRDMKMKIVKNCEVSSGNHDPLTFYIHRHSIPEQFLRLMRVLVMNSLETKFYSNCRDAKFLDFVGYRNELSILSMTSGLLNYRLRVLRNVQFNTDDNMAYWQKFSLMYRGGQENIFETVLQKIEEMKRSLIQKMDQDIKEKRIAPQAPFLSIVNPEYHQSTVEIDSGSPYISLDSVLITLKKLLAKDAKLSAAVGDLFEDLQEEEDIIMMLALINERNNDNSEWKPFFDKVTSSSTIALDENLQEMYRSMMPDFSDAFPEIFDLSVFSMDAFAWADHLLNNYSIDNPLSIVPL